MRMNEDGSLNGRKVKEDDQGGQTDGVPVVKATRLPQETPHVGTTLACSSIQLLPASPHPEGHRGILQAGSCFLGAVPSITLVLLTSHSGEGHRDQTSVYSGAAVKDKRVLLK